MYSAGPVSDEDWLIADRSRAHAAAPQHAVNASNSTRRTSASVGAFAKHVASQQHPYPHRSNSFCGNGRGSVGWQLTGGTAVGDDYDEGQTLEDAYNSTLEFAERYPEFAAMAEKLRAAPPSPRVIGTPLILHVRIEPDPHTAIALACAARVRELALVIGEDMTSARFARHMLDLHGRTDVSVVAADLGGTEAVAGIEGLIPDTVALQSTEMLAAVRAVCGDASGAVRWVGYGPLTSLARIHRAAPESARKLVISQTVGITDDPDPSQAEQNLRADPEATQHVLANYRQLTLVMPDAECVDAIAISRAHHLYRTLASSGAGAALLVAHLDNWFDAGHRFSTQYAALTFSIALELPFGELAYIALNCDERGALDADPAGYSVWLATGADYPSLERWLIHHLTHEQDHTAK